MCLIIASIVLLIVFLRFGVCFYQAIQIASATKIRSTLTNAVVFIPLDYLPPCSTAIPHAGDFLISHAGGAFSCPFSVRVPAGAEESRFDKTKFVFEFNAGTSNERPEQCEQQNHHQYPDKDEVPRAYGWRRGKREIWICTAVAGNQPKTVRMIIKDQNPLYSLG
jgi:hypothetical protein